MYIIYTIDEVMDDLGCSKGKALKVMAELDSVRGIGLIERQRRGFGQSDVIFVKRFITVERVPGPSRTDLSSNNYSSTDIEPIEVQKIDHDRFNFCTTISSKNEPRQVQNLDPNNTKYNNTDFNNTDFNNTDPLYLSSSLSSTCPKSLHLSSTTYSVSPNCYYGSEEGETKEIRIYDASVDGVRRDDVPRIEKTVLTKPEDIVSGNTKVDNAYGTLIREQTDLEDMVKETDLEGKEIANKLYRVMCDVVNDTKSESFRISGMAVPAEVVKSRFLKIKPEYFRYAVSKMRLQSRNVRNFRAYALTLLYHCMDTKQGSGERLANSSGTGQGLDKQPEYCAGKRQVISSRAVYSWERKRTSKDWADLERLMSETDPITKSRDSPDVSRKEDDLNVVRA